MNIPLYIKRKKTVKFFHKPYVSFYVWFEVSLDFIIIEVIRAFLSFQVDELIRVLLSKQKGKRANC